MGVMPQQTLRKNPKKDKSASPRQATRQVDHTHKRTLTNGNNEQRSIKCCQRIRIFRQRAHSLSLCVFFVALSHYSYCILVVILKFPMTLGMSFPILSFAVQCYVYVRGGIVRLCGAVFGFAKLRVCDVCRSSSYSVGII